VSPLVDSSGDPCGACDFVFSGIASPFFMPSRRDGIGRRLERDASKSNLGTVTLLDGEFIYPRPRCFFPDVYRWDFDQPGDGWNEPIGATGALEESA